jgi:hypothetical protein
MNGRNVVWNYCRSDGGDLTVSIMIQDGLGCIGLDRYSVLAFVSAGRNPEGATGALVLCIYTIANQSETPGVRDHPLRYPLRSDAVTIDLGVEVARMFQREFHS